MWPESQPTWTTSTSPEAHCTLTLLSNSSRFAGAPGRPPPTDRSAGQALEGDRQAGGSVVIIQGRAAASPITENCPGEAHSEPIPIVVTCCNRHRATQPRNHCSGCGCQRLVSPSLTSHGPELPRAGLADKTALTFTEHLLCAWPAPAHVFSLCFHNGGEVGDVLISFTDKAQSSERRKDLLQTPRPCAKASGPTRPGSTWRGPRLPPCELGEDRSPHS